MQFLIGLDQLVNTLFGGWADETISARAFRCHTKKLRWQIAMHIIDTLFFWQTRHCMQSYVSEQKRRQLPPSYREQIIESSGD